VLVSTCWLTDSGGPPTPVPVAIKSTMESTLGMSKTEDQMIGDFSYTGDSKKIGTVTKITEKGNAYTADLPYWAGN